MHVDRNNRSNWSRLSAGWCALALYVLACSPVGAGLTALIGSLDSNHQLLIGAGQRGNRLVLHHDSRSASSHHHGVAARALTLFAQPNNAGSPDHVVQLSSPDTLKGESRTSASNPKCGHVVLLVPGRECLARAHLSSASTLAPAYSLDAGTPSLALRSTVLLI